MGYISTWTGECFSSLLVSLMAFSASSLYTSTPFGLVLWILQRYLIFMVNLFLDNTGTVDLEDAMIVQREL